MCLGTVKKIKNNRDRFCLQLFLEKHQINPKRLWSEAFFLPFMFSSKWKVLYGCTNDHVEVLECKVFQLLNSFIIAFVFFIPGLVFSLTQNCNKCINEVVSFNKLV